VGILSLLSFANKLLSGEVVNENINKMKYIIKFIFCWLICLTNLSLAEVTIIQFVEVGPLNLNKKGIIEVLEQNNIAYKYYNAQGQAALAKQIVNKVMSGENDMVITITTPVTLLAVSSRTGDSKPIVFSAVSDPVAAKIIKVDNYKENLITGASDSPPVAQTFEIIERVLHPKRIGVLYSNSEINSVESLRYIKQHFGEKYEIVEAAVANTNMVKPAVDKLVGEVDVVYVPLDSTILSSLELATRILKKHNIPVVSNDPDTLPKGVLIAVGFNEYEVGKEAGLKAVRILNAVKNNDNLENLKVTTPQKFDIKINKNLLSDFGITLPENMQQYLY
jgi:putative ABC transport system substrate-binding protein